MAGSVFDSPLFAKLFPTADAGRLFTDTAEVRAMMLVEGTLAKLQGEMGVIPLESAMFIHRASMELQIDPGGLAVSTGQNGVCVPGLVAQFRKEMQAPEHAQYLHWGATSQDIIDSALMLRLRQLLAVLDKDLRAVLERFATLAETHANLAMAARTWGQHATVTSFGAQVAEWGAPLLDLSAELPALRHSSLWVSLSGAAGTASALGPSAGDQRAALAKGLGLGDPQRSWHVDRGPILRIAAWMTRLSAALGKLGEDLTLLAQTGISEVSFGPTGASSTMPQKQNPVAPAAISALARHVTGLNAILQLSGQHRQQRDGIALMSEWLSLPQLCLATASALSQSKTLADTLCPNSINMATSLNSHLGLIHAEALSFALAELMPRPDAQDVTKTLCREAMDSGQELAKLLARDHPDLDITKLFTADQQMGLAPQSATDFAQQIRAL